MSWLMAAVYARFMRGSEEACLAQWRAELLRDLSGAVLEVGAGTGVTLPHYPKSIARLVLSEPDAHMRRKLKRKVDAAALRNIEISDAPLDSLRSEEHTSELQSPCNLVCRLLLEKKNI